MNLEINQIYHGFKLNEIKELKEIGSTGYTFIHEKTAAKLFYLSNEDDNKVFSISFRTPPEDSTGLPHILEHSVLCGSEKYPIKEPFVELMKGSLNTFLNAMTFPDKTIYPIASMNDKDFINLMDVYLDAVFKPKIYEDKGIFLQEGWHYHLENKDDDIKYIGVVYNEMKGAFSNPEEIISRKIQETLFPDTPYGKESGGDPDVIIDLTYADFINFHKKYYHPSNSYIYFYGDGNILEHLAYVNDNYLKDYDLLEIDSSIPMQKAFDKPVEKVYTYPIAKQESTKDKTYLTMNWVTGTSKDSFTNLGLEILAHILLNSPSAPLKKALLDAQLGKDVSGSFSSGILQPLLNVVIKNTEEDKKTKLIKVIEETLQDLVKNGIDKDQIEAAVNITEFRLKEADFGRYPKGLIYGISIMESWLYDEDPTMYLEYEENLNNIREAAKTGYFEELIQKYLLGNNHKALIITKPEPGLVDKNEEEINNRLKEFKESLSEKELENLIEESKKLKDKQNTPDSPEALETIPLLPIEDIDEESKELPLQVNSIGTAKVLYSPINTNGIVYTDLLFDIRSVDKEMIPYVALLGRYLGEVSTEKYPFNQLTNEINIYTGGIDFDIDAYGDIKNIEDYSPKLIVRGKALNQNLPKLLELIKEILCNTKYEEKQRLKEIIQSSKSRTEGLINGAGHKMVANRVQSYYSKSAKFLEYINGFDYYDFIKELEENIDSNMDDIFTKLKEAAGILFNKNNVIISLTCNKEDYENYEREVNILLDSFAQEEVQLQDFDLKLEKSNEGLMTSSKVQYVGKSYNIKKLGYDYTGKLQVLRTIASTDYLWNKIRVQGGAYGAFFTIGKSGSIFAGSYRDPNLQETVNTIDGLADYIENLDISERELNKYIIGTISNLDIPLSPFAKGITATAHHLGNITQKDIQRERDEVLSCTVKDIVDTAEIIRDSMDENYICVLGNDKKIEESKDLFEKCIQIFK